MSVVKRHTSLCLGFAMSTATRGTDQRVLLNDVSWARFVALSNEARGGRLAYDQGRLEIMSPSFEHESIKGLIGRLVEVFTEEFELDIASAGSTTLSRADLSRAIESDECYYVAGAPQVRGKDNIELPANPPPDLVIEVGISRSSIDKLVICAAIGVSEVWRYDGVAIEVYTLEDDGQYKKSAASVVLPQFPLDALKRGLQKRGSRSETQIVRGFRGWIRQHLRR
jgi:Uma2 family endonuclease